MCMYAYMLWDTVGNRVYTLSHILREEILCLADAMHCKDKPCIYTYGIYCMD